MSSPTLQTLTEASLQVSCLITTLEHERISSKKLRAENAALRSYWRSRDIISGLQGSDELTEAFEALCIKNLTLEAELTDGGGAEDSSSSLNLALQVSHLLSENSSLQERLEAGDDKSRELRTRLASLTASNTSEREAKNASRTENKDLADRMGTLEVSVKEANRQLDVERTLRRSYKGKFISLKGDCDRLRSALNRSETEVSTVKKTAAANGKKLSNRVKIAVASAVKAAEGVQKRNTELEREVLLAGKKGDASISRLKAKLSGELDRFHRDATTKDGTIRELNARVHDFERLGDEARDAASEQQRCIDELIATQEGIVSRGEAEWGEKREVLGGRINELEGEVAQLRGEVLRLEGELTNEKENRKTRKKSVHHHYEDPIHHYNAHDEVLGEGVVAEVSPNKEVLKMKRRASC